MTENNAAVRRMTGALLVSMVAYAAANSLLSVLLNDVIEAFSVVGTKQGLMSSMLSVGTLAAVLSSPFLQGRFRKTTLILIAGVLLGLGSVLTGLSASFAALIVMCVVVGVGAGWIDVCLSAAMIDAHPADSTHYLSLLHGFYGVGGLTAPLLIAALLRAVTWRGTYVAFGAGILAAFVVVLFLFRASTAGETVAPEQKLTGSDMREYFSSRRSWLLIACALLSFVTQTGIIAWVVRYLRLAFGTSDYGSAAISAYWICLTVNRFLFPRIKMKPMKLYTLGSALFALSFAAGILVRSPLALCVACGLGGLTSGHMIPVMLGECAIGYEGRSTLTTSVVMLTACAARIATPLLMAWLTAAFSADAGMWFVPASGAVAVACGLLVLRSDRKTVPAVPES